MIQLGTSDAEQKTQSVEGRLQDEDHDLPRVYEDRRRPGRRDHVNPNLVLLLRGEAAPPLLASDRLVLPDGQEHALPLFGIAVSVLMSIPLWGVLGLLAWTILHWVR